MQCLKDAVINSLALGHIDYECGREIVLAIDTSNIAVGYILMQLGEDGKRYPSCFGSLSVYGYLVSGTSLSRWTLSISRV